MSMPEVTLLSRSEVPAEYTWNAPSVFPSVEAWEAEFKSLAESLPDAARFQGHLADGPASLAEAREAAENLLRRVGRVYVYASMSHNVDTTDQAATRMLGRAQGLFGQVAAALAYFDPELLAIGREKLEQWLKAEPRLADFAHYVDDLFRRQAHVRSAEVEELLGLAADPFSGPRNLANLLTSSDFKFPPAKTSDGKELPVSESTIDDVLAQSDRAARRTGWVGYQDTYLAFRNTLAVNLVTAIKQNVFLMRARRHASSLEASLFANNIPVEVFHNLINTYRKHLPLWHRYWRIRRKALGVETLHPYDIWAPLTDRRPHVPYAQAVQWICEGLAPLGADYVNVVRRGCLEDRWVDVMPNKGKTGGAFSSGWPGTHPFILMSYDDTIFSLSTLAHELGHSMHSYLTWKTQPFTYSQYSLFVAEVASNFNQAMVRAHLLNTNPDRAFQISVIEEAMANFHRYFFIMPTLARFELETHERIERGQGLTADDMIALMADLFSEGYGSEMHVDRERVGITWATFGHLYADYYVYQYATGISGANALARRILDGAPGAAEAYLNFLKAGGAVYALDALKLAGVDLATPEPVEAAFSVLSGLMDRLEQLTSA
jgi:oligoendopeptidase F